MSQVNRSYAPPSAKSFPLTIDRTMIGGIATVEIDNGSALTLTVTADGQLIRTVTPYTTRFNVNTGPAWSQVTITANAATIQTTDSLTIVCYDTTVVPPLPPSFGVSAWGGGADPGALQQINAGDEILAWQLRQFYLALTGAIAVSGPLNVNGQIDVFGALIASSLTSAARISSSHVGVSDKTLLNYVPIAPASTSFSGSGNVAATSFTVNTLPSSAVALSGWLEFSCPQAGASAGLIRAGDANTGLTAFIATAAIPGNTCVNGGALPCLPAASNQLQYVINQTGGQSWSLVFVLTGYWEAG